MEDKKPVYPMKYALSFAFLFCFSYINLSCVERFFFSDVISHFEICHLNTGNIWKENPGTLEKSPADGLAYIGDMGWLMIHTKVHTLDQQVSLIL